MEDIYMENIIKTEVILEFMEKNNLSPTAFCKFCKISKSSYDKIMNNDLRVKIKTVLKIMVAMKIRLNQLVNK